MKPQSKLMELLQGHLIPEGSDVFLIDGPDEVYLDKVSDRGHVLDDEPLAGGIGENVPPAGDGVSVVHGQIPYVLRADIHCKGRGR